MRTIGSPARGALPSVAVKAIRTVSPVFAYSSSPVSTELKDTPEIDGAVLLKKTLASWIGSSARDVSVTLPAISTMETVYGTSPSMSSDVIVQIAS